MTLNQRIKRLETLLAEIISKLDSISKNVEEKSTPPYSKVKKQLRFENLPVVFDGEDGLWKPYAIYKDDEEEE